MYSYNDFDKTCKAWVYQASRALTSQEETELNTLLNHFIEDWFSHGNALKAYAEIKHQQFVVFIVDEQGDKMCGRAIDGSVKFMQEIEKDFDMSFLDRMLVSYRYDENICVTALNEFQSKVENGTITPDTIVFNNTITTKNELENKWEVALKDSWHSRFLPVSV